MSFKSAIDQSVGTTYGAIATATAATLRALYENYNRQPSERNARALINYDRLRKKRKSDLPMPFTYGRSGKFVKTRRTRKKKVSRRKKATKKLALKASLSLCEPKMLRSTEQFCSIGHNIPQFFTGALNIAICTNEQSVYTGGFEHTGGAFVNPRWSPLIEDVETAPYTNGPPIGALGSNQQPIGRYMKQTHPTTSQATDILFDSSDSAKFVYGRHGSEICPSKLVYKITFNASQAFEPAGVSAKYVCYLFRYKAEQPSGYTAAAQHGHHSSVAARANNMPLTNVGRNTSLQARDFFKGRDGEGQDPWGVDSVTAAPTTLNTGNPVVDDMSYIQLAMFGRASNKELKVVSKKEFSFDYALAYSESSASRAPQHSNTVYLSHRFKPGTKIKYGLQVNQLADSAAGTEAVEGPSIMPRGYNYGVCIVANATKTVFGSAPPEISYMENWQWDDNGGQATPGRLAAYTISKSLYYKDP